jgi:hypothetical protein
MAAVVGAWFQVGYGRVHFRRGAADCFLCGLHVAPNTPAPSTREWLEVPTDLGRVCAICKRSFENLKTGAIH